MPPRPPSQETPIILAMISELRDMRKESSEQYNDLHCYVVQEFKEIREAQTEILSRLASGSERMENMDRRITSIEQGGATTALTPKRKPVDTSSGRVPIKSKAPPWYVLALAGGALTLAGERLYRWGAFIISQDPQTQVQASATPGKP